MYQSLRRYEHDQVVRDREAEDLEARTQVIYLRMVSTFSEGDLIDHLGNFGESDVLDVVRMTAAFRARDDLALGQAVSAYLRKELMRLARDDAEKGLV